MDPFSLSHLFKTVKNGQLNRKLWLPIEHVLGFRKLSNVYKRVSRATADEFISATLKELNSDYVIAGPIKDVPKTGPLIIVSNHPFGALEALILLDYTAKYRSETKVMANIFLNRIHFLSDSLFGVNPFKDSRAKKSNLKIMRDILQWLQSGHCLITFPAGNVSHIHLRSASIIDAEWDQQIAHLARSTKATILPVHIEGKNSRWFYLLGPKLHALRYGNELLNKQNKTIKIRIGSVITPEKIASIPSNADLINYCRLKSDELVFIEKTKVE